MNTVILVLAFVAIAFLVYKLWKPIIAPPKREVPANEARIYLFYTEWCGHSKKAMPEWTKLERKLKAESYFGKTHVTAVRVNCETDKKTAMIYGINAYPTVVLETSTGIHEYNKKVDMPNLIGFLRETLGKERESL